MGRIKAHSKYIGTDFFGWQRQKEGRTVQGEIEKVLSTYYRQPVSIVGCGRTDTGVHATQYVFHFDLIETPSQLEIKGINAMLPDDVSVMSLEHVDSDFHARYSCVYRAYDYKLHRIKDPFLRGRSYNFFQFDKLDRERIEEAAGIIKEYDEFFPFCKSHSGVDHYRCSIFRSEWHWDDEQRIGRYHIAGNRFLRGMVRLLVGVQLNIGLGKVSIEQLKSALDQQNRLDTDWSVPAEGLALSEIRYP